MFIGGGLYATHGDETAITPRYLATQPSFAESYPFDGVALPDLTNDNDWAIVESNAKLAARICREGKLKGFWLDTEQYTQYRTRAISGTAEFDADTVMKVRRDSMASVGVLFGQLQRMPRGRVTMCRLTFVSILSARTIPIRW